MSCPEQPQPQPRTLSPRPAHMPFVYGDTQQPEQPQLLSQPEQLIKSLWSTDLKLTPTQINRINDAFTKEETQADEQGTSGSLLEADTPTIIDTQGG